MTKPKRASIVVTLFAFVCIASFWSDQRSNDAVKLSKTQITTTILIPEEVDVSFALALKKTRTWEDSVVPEAEEKKKPVDIHKIRDPKDPFQDLRRLGETLAEFVPDDSVSDADLQNIVDGTSVAGKLQSEKESSAAEMPSPGTEKESKEDSKKEAEKESKEGAEKENSEEEFDPRQLATAFFCCIVVIIIGTILFDAAKESVMETAETLKPVVNAMFAELTVLGFIGLLTFVLARTGALAAISFTVFTAHGNATTKEIEENKERIPKMFEKLHMMLFLVMVIFGLEVGLLIWYGKWQKNRWDTIEKIEECPVNLTKALKAYDGQAANEPPGPNEGLDFGREGWCSCATGGTIDADTYLDYLALRAEFFDPRKAKKGQTVNRHFDFADYLDLALSKTLAHLITISAVEWSVLLSLMLVLYLNFMAMGCSIKALQCVVTCVMYILTGMLLVLINKLHKIKKALVCGPKAREFLVNEIQLAAARSHTEQVPAKEDTANEMDKSVTKSKLKGPGASLDNSGSSDTGNGTNGNGTNGNGTSAAPDEQSLLVKDPDAPPFESFELLKAAPWYTTTNQIPNKHEALFWFTTRGPSLNQRFLQVVLVCMAIYLPLLAQTVSLFDHEYTWVYAVFVIFALLPIPIIFSQSSSVLQLQLLVTNVEMLVDPHIVQESKLKQHSKKVVSLMKTISSLQQKSEVFKSADVLLAHENELLLKHTDPSRKKELEDLFDVYDKDNNKALDVTEMANFLVTIGTERAQAEKLAEFLCEKLDNDGSGTVDKGEFVSFMLITDQKQKAPESSSSTIAKGMFDLFDADGNGDVSREEMKDQLAKFGLALDNEEIALLMRELDTDETGSIDVDDFKRMLEKHGIGGPG